MITALLYASALHVLVIGGGPDPFNNQVGIESNVRYMGKLVRSDTPFRVLFADGNRATKSVRYQLEEAPEEKVGPFSVPGSKNRYREPDVPRMDGPSLLENVKAEIEAVAKSKKPSLIYFTGHGTLARDLKVSQFDLWSDQRFAVPDLVTAMKSFGKNQPVTFLMVQCHSSDFANAMYVDGDPKLGLAENRLCGFYASISARVAAGCSPAVKEANYKDFSSYFLAALTGQDRMGQPSTGADFDRNGWVGMNEAFCWSLIHDESIDTPICTSDIFLRNAIPTPDEEIFKAPYADVLKWANPAQKAALEGLSTHLKLEGEDRLATAFAKYEKLGPNDMREEPIFGYRFISLARSVVLNQAMKKVRDRAVRRRYDTLVKDEAANPFRK